MKNYHFVGIGGIGMSALAHLLLEKQEAVSGSDLSENKQTKALVKKGAKVKIGHHAKEIHKDQVVVYSSAVKADNPEYMRALELNCQLVHRSSLLAELMKGSKNLAVAGSHGKTTTSSLLAHTLLHAGLDPSYALGGLYNGCNGHVGKGEHFVFEADESDGTFSAYVPHYAIVTNLGHEHLDHYGNFETLEQAMVTFCHTVKEKVIYCKDDPHLTCTGISYGFHPQADVHIHAAVQQDRGQKVTLKAHQIEYSYFIPLLGRHNAQNSAAVFTLALHLGIDPSVIVAAFKTFPGIARRMEHKQTTLGIDLYDDYAHHPTEIKTTLEGAKKQARDRRLIVLFQPHRFTRTKAHFDEFVKAFSMADLVYITDIYAAGEQPIPGITAEALVDEISKHVPCHYLPRESWLNLNVELRPHDFFVSMGAGDITTIHLGLEPKKKLKVGVIYGGRSPEHPISCRSAQFVMENLDSKLYNVQPFYIDQQGGWALKKGEKSHSLFHPHISKAMEGCDLFFPVLHGPYGEDGTIQGLFEMLNRPYVGCGVGASALAMNKMLAKEVAATCGVLTPHAVSFTKQAWHHQKESCRHKLQTVSLPCFVKPNHLGSSIGTSKVTSHDQLHQAIDHAFSFDTVVLVEESIENPREIEFPIIGNAHGFGIHVPTPGEKLAEGAFVDYQLKYSDQPVPTTTTPHLSPQLLQKGKEAARKVYEAIGCSGMSRVDFLLDRQGKWWFFELNTIPGMQALSLFPKVWKQEGVEASKLLDKLIIYAMAAHAVK